MACGSYGFSLIEIGKTCIVINKYIKYELENFVCSVVCLAGMTCAEAVNYTPENVSASIALKVPGNDAKRYPLTLQQLDNSNFEYQWVAADKLPVVIYQNVEEKDGNQRIVIL